VDIGNTLVKLAVFDDGRLVAQRCAERLLPSMLDDLLSGRRAAKAVVASTRGATGDAAERRYFWRKITSQCSPVMYSTMLSTSSSEFERW